MSNCLVAQSGGPTSAINASLAGVIDAVNKSDKYDKIYGLLNGITGLFEDRYIDLSEKFVTDEAINTLKTTPAMFLGSCRYQLPGILEDETIYEQIFEFFELHDIGAFFYIGGNDSMDTAMKLSAYAREVGSDIRVIGVPKTIDNDLVCIDHTPGFGSAAKYVASSILEMAYDVSIYNIKSVTIVEVRGRDAGWLTAASALARTEYSLAPHLIYLPEVAFDEAKFVEDVSKKVEEFGNVMVAISEGARDAKGNYISASDSKVDEFGHAQLSGAGKTLEHIVSRELGIKARSVEINIMQRCGAHFSSKTDIDEAFLLGSNAVGYAENGQTGVLSSLTRTSSSPYEVSFCSAALSEVANQVKPVPREYINEDGNDVTPEAIEYMRPLIMGEVEIAYKDGLPAYVPIHRG